MKQDRHAAEYDKVRRRAGMARPPAEFPDDTPDPARVAAAHQDFKDRMAEGAEHDLRRAAESKARVDELQHRANLSVLLTEYARAGVEPPYAKENGEPKFSLGFLLRIGWTIAEFPDNKKKMVSPIGAKNL